MRMKLKAERLGNIVEIVNAIVNETKIAMDEKGMKIKAVDSSHVAMVDLSVGSEAFDEYEVDGENEIALDLSKLNQFLSIVGAADQLELSVEDSRLKATAGNITQEFPLLDTEGMTEPDLPDLDLGNEMKMEAGFLKKGIRAVSMVSDQLKIKADSDQLRIMGEEDQDVVDTTVDADFLPVHEVSDDVESVFAIDYLKDMVSSVSTNAPLEVRLESDYPIEIEYKFADGHGNATMMLAPRIESS